MELVFLARILFSMAAHHLAYAAVQCFQLKSTKICVGSILVWREETVPMD